LLTGSCGGKIRPWNRVYPFLPSRLAPDRVYRIFLSPGDPPPKRGVSPLIVSVALSVIAVLSGNPLPLGAISVPGARTFLPAKAG